MHDEARLMAALTESKRNLELVSLRRPKPIALSIWRDGGANNVAVQTAALRACIFARFLELVRTSIVCIESRQPAAAITLVRAALESMAMLHDLKLRLEGVVATPTQEDVKALEEFVQCALYGRRYQVADEKAVNMMTRIDRLAKRVPAISSVYENLCEVAHPNSDGLIGLYMRFVESTDELAFDTADFTVFLAVAANNLSTTLDAFVIWDNDIRAAAAEIERLVSGSSGTASPA